MVIWRIEGREIGSNGNGAAHFPTKGDANKAISEYHKWYREKWGSSDDEIVPERLEIKDKKQLARLLDDAMGYGAS